VKAHVEIKIRIKDLPTGGLHELLREFVRSASDLEFPEAQSEEYQKHHGSSAGFAVMLPRGELPPGAVAIASLDRKHPNSFRVPNIVPRECSSLTLEQYNAIGLAFASDFRAWLKLGPIRGTLEVTGPNRTLEEIIRGEKCRRFFEAWLHSPTLISHPSDLYALDRFICHLFRHRGEVRVYEIESYLIEDRSWNPDTARWAVARIEAGLELLRVNREF